MRHRAAWLAVTLAVFAPALALAQPSPAPQEAGRTHFENGARAYDIGDYALAMREFRAAHEASGHPDLLYNVYAAAERLGDLEAAREALSRYLREADVEAERRAALEQRLARLDARIEEGSVEPEPEPPLPLPPAPGAPVAPLVVEPRDDGPSVAPIVLFATSGALVASFGVFAALSTAEDSRLDDRCGIACTDDEIVRLRAYNGVADASWILATVAGAAGLTVLLVERGRDDDAQASVALSPLALRRGGGLALEGRF